MYILLDPEMGIYPQQIIMKNEEEKKKKKKENHKYMQKFQEFYYSTVYNKNQKLKYPIV